MASSKKTGSPRKKTGKSEAIESKVEDAVIVEAETSTDATSVEVSDQPDKAEKSEAEAATVADAADPDVQTVEEIALQPTEDAKEADATEQEISPMPEGVAPAPEAEKKSVFLPLVLGGIVAGAIGFMASEYEVFGQADSDITTKLRSDLNTQQERIAALETAEPPAVDIPTVDLSPIETELAEIQDRLAALEERPVVSVPEGVDAEAIAAYTAELEALKASAETQRSEIEALLNNAKSVEEATADAAKAASAQTAIAKIVSAIDAGRPYSDAIATLNDLDLGEIDPALAASADSGVATLSVLQSEFPAEARTALAAARATGSGDGQQGLGGFLKRSLGARSVAPKEGNDPDAVLSRAEAAIKRGDLATTLTELDTLPEEAQAAIADWRAAADARIAARNAADALAQRLTAD
ncbi:hypothetical protein [uncultured Sulfitobacter sp.]|uniref:COG4223 family protein n=1 Tax=uncultured Sulfitobacter sp. TaxID=191468 RepID=UPI00260ECF89|nr:hypothetical protein [uncultured Sulfitobacter sp.]